MPSLTPKNLRLIGFAILLAGCCLGGFIYWTGMTANSPDDDEDDPSSEVLTTENSKQVLRSVELYSGQMGVLAGNLRNAWADWQHPKPIGITIAIISCLAALLTFFLASRRMD